MENQSAPAGSMEWSIALLQKHVVACDEILLILGKRHEMTPVEREHVRGLYVAFRHELDVDLAQLTRRRSQRTATDIESAFVNPGINEAHALPYPPTDTDPLRREWFDTIESAQAQVKHYLDQLKSPLS